MESTCVLNLFADLHEEAVLAGESCCYKRWQNSVGFSFVSRIIKRFMFNWPRTNSLIVVSGKRVKENIHVMISPPSVESD